MIKVHDQIKKCPLVQRKEARELTPSKRNECR